MKKFHTIIALLCCCLAFSTTTLANTAKTKDPVLGNKEKPAVKKSEPVKESSELRYPYVDASTIYPPTDSVKNNMYADSIPANQYPHHLKGHYLSRQPFRNSVNPSYNLKSRFFGVDQTMMDVPKL